MAEINTTEINTTDVRRAFILAGGNVLLFQEWLDELLEHEYKGAYREGYDRGWKEGYMAADYDNTIEQNFS